MARECSLYIKKGFTEKFRAAKIVSNSQNYWCVVFIYQKLRSRNLQIDRITNVFWWHYYCQRIVIKKFSNMKKPRLVLLDFSVIDAVILGLLIILMLLIKNYNS